MEYEVATRVSSIFSNLGWEVSREERVEIEGSRQIVFDLVLRYEGKVYGYVEVLDRDSLERKAKEINNQVQFYIQKTKPLIFVITNGVTYDIFHLGKSYGSLTVPPSPKDVNFLFGGEE